MSASASTSSVASPRHTAPPASPGTTPDFDALERFVARAPGERSRHEIFAPFTLERLGSIPCCTEADVEAAVAAARRAQAAWAQRPLAHRTRVLQRLHDLVLARQDEILDLIQLESGKTRLHAFEEVGDTAVVARYYAYHADRHLRPARRRGAFPLITRTREYRHPIGVVGLIAPWNYPFTMALTDAIPALVAGNAVVLKPAEQTTYTALLGAQLLAEAGLPEGLFQIVTGRGEVLGPPLIRRVDFVGFTGSTAVGRIVARQAAERLIPCSLELGGKNPMIVLDDADVAAAVDGAVRGCFASAGQLCVSIERIYVARKRFDAFAEAFAERARTLRLGAEFAYGPEMGSLVSEEQLEKVEAHVADARAQGATIVAGGRRRDDLGPLFYAPTLVTGVQPAMRMAREETFGPVVALYPFDADDEAVRLANEGEYGLNASVWTADVRRGRRLAERIHAGTVNINEAYAATWASVDAPMGGVKASGLGRRHGAQGILKYTEAQTVSTQHLLSISPPPPLSDRTFARLITVFLRTLRHLPGLR